MQDLLLFFEAYQAWIYLLLGIAAMLYGRMLVRAYHAYQAAIFGLERERSRASLLRSGAILALVTAGFMVTFIVTTFAVPAIPAALRPTPIPTVSLLATSLGEGADPAVGFVTATPFSVDQVDSAGCATTNATIIEPASGERVRGKVEFQGVANIPGFAFYKLEYHDLQVNSTWLAISASNTTVCEQGCPQESLLGIWDSSLVRPGQYAVQLVVTDTQSNAPLPCQIILQVEP
ncbi:MAG: hypothetical protein E4G90_10285 [Gemmatimonadales bacterium]|nr:MAG: hypothetical protein E4G90_10285 [Gemmatimonadales bacterium]